MPKKARATGFVVGIALTAALIISGCQAVKTDDAASPSSAVPPAVAPQEVLQAVAAAATQKTLPTSIDNAALLAASGDDTSEWAVPDCTPALEASSLDDIEPCILGDTGSENTMVLMGDSGAAMWHGALDLVGKRTGWKVIALTKNNCGPAALTYYQWQLERDFTECDAWQEWRLGVIKEQQAKIVVMAGWYGGNLGPNRAETPAVWRDGLVKSAQQLPAGTKVFMLGNQPHPEQAPAECVADNPDDLTACALPAATVIPDQTGWSQAAAQVGATYIDVDPWFCTEVCPAVIADQIVYAGKYHITKDYGEYLSGSIESIMAPELAS